MHDGHLPTTRIIKPGRSSRLFLLFTGSRKHSSGESHLPAPILVIITLITILLLTLFIAFLKGKLG